MKFISFLGTGPDGNGYSELDYETDDHNGTITTEFVQRAEIEYLGPDRFEKIYILCTDESYRHSFPDLRDELLDELKIAGDIIEHINIGKIDGIESAWVLFEKISRLIDHGDTLVFDVTHGFRSLSIILSAALNYILKAKENIHLKHVFYGEKREDQKGQGHIVDMKDFYVIHEWADGVSRLIENADIAKLAVLARQDENHSFRNLNDENLIEALKDLTDTLKNIDVNRISRNTQNALEILTSQQVNGDGVEKELLELVEKKFKPLNVKSTGRYDRNYFNLQIQIIRMLNQHKLYMQSFTVIRELIGSIGMLGAPTEMTENMWDNEAADKRPRYAELFVRMMNFTKSFTAKGADEAARVNELANTVCRRIEQCGMLDDLKSITKKITKVRNGFDHAWTGKGDSAARKIGDSEDVEKIAEEAADFLDHLITSLIQDNAIQ